jgi:hypothetical protein
MPVECFPDTHPLHKPTHADYTFTTKSNTPKPKSGNQMTSAPKNPIFRLFLLSSLRFISPLGCNVFPARCTFLPTHN